MTSLLYVCAGILFIIIQTTILPHLYLFDRMYDLLIPLLIHASIFRSLGECLFLVVVFGALMDNLSGSPAGFYLTFYVWLFIGVRYLKLFLHVGSLSLVTLVVLFAVAVESLTLIGLVSVNHLMMAGTGNALRFAFTEVFWATLTAPFLLMGLNYLLQKLPLWQRAITSSRQDEIRGR